MNSCYQVLPGFYNIRVLYYLKDGSVTVDYHERYFRNPVDAKAEIDGIREGIRQLGGINEMIAWEPKQ